MSEESHDARVKQDVPIANAHPKQARHDSDVEMTWRNEESGRMPKTTGETKVDLKKNSRCAP